VSLRWVIGDVFRETKSVLQNLGAMVEGGS